MSKTELTLENPLMNAAGTLGFSPDLKGPVNFSRLGAFITNPISWESRTPTKGERFIPFPGGFLLHTGYPNPGLKEVIRHHTRRWSRSPLPIIIHLLAQDVYTVERMVTQLEGIEGVIGIEIGLPPDIDPETTRLMALVSLGELAVIIRLPFENADNLLPELSTIGINAVSIAPPRGILPGPDGSLVSGRLYGPSIFPQALAKIKSLSQFGVPIIGSGGVYSGEDSLIFMNTGVIAVQLDSVLWQYGFMLKG